MEAVILAGGLGTRLRETIADIPKPMAPVNGKPFLWYILNYLSKSGIKRVILSTGYKADIIIEYFGNIFENIELKYVIEDEPLGTGGAVLKSIHEVTSENIVIINGDTWFPVDLGVMLGFHTKYKSSLTVALKEMTHFDRYGSVEISGSRITAFREKTYCEKGLINGGLYITGKKFIESLALPEKFSFEKRVLENLAGSTELCGFISDADFIDIGIPADYNRASRFLQND